MRHVLFSCTRALLIGWTCLAIATAHGAGEPSGAKLGTVVRGITFQDTGGKTVSLRDLAAKKAVVVVFLNFDCPNSTGYSLILADLARAYLDKVAFVGVCPCDDETAATIAQKAEEHKFAFPVYKDDKYVAVDAFHAETTPEAFLLDRDLVLRYRGRIDDAYSARLKKNLKVTSHDLQSAIDELLAGRPITVPVTRAVGCSIVPTKSIKKDGKITYYRDVLPILENNCQTCHRPGEVGPFSLMTYKQAANWASDIKEYTQSRQMPPWKITEGLHFHNERKLTDTEIQTLAAWADSGAAEGDPKDAPPPKKFTDGWMLGKPDLILQPAEDFILGATGPDLFRCFVLPTGLTEDKYVVAIEVKPSNPRVVHHTLNFHDAIGQGRKLEEAAQKTEKEGPEKKHDRGPGYTVAMGIGFFPKGGLGGWAPGQLGHRLPEGYGWLLPKGSDVVVQVHYHRNGRVEKDRTQIGLYFAKKNDGMRRYRGGVIAGRLLAIPANDPHFPVTGSVKVLEECELRTIMPHMHLIGRQIKVLLKPADGGTAKVLLNIADWDYNWQETYFLETPMKLHPGDELQVEAVYDNSSKNLNNPNKPPRMVFVGEQTTNEMCFVFLGATSNGPGRSPFARPMRLTRPGEKKDAAKPVEGKKPG
jgi:hypothetical protein